MPAKVLRGFEHSNFRQRSSWETDAMRTVVPTGWSERRYDIRLLYGLPEVSVRPFFFFLKKNSHESSSHTLRK